MISPYRTISPERDRDGDGDGDGDGLDSMLSSTSHHFRHWIVNRCFFEGWDVMARICYVDGSCLGAAVGDGDGDGEGDGDGLDFEFALEFHTDPYSSGTLLRHFFERSGALSKAEPQLLELQ